MRRNTVKSDKDLHRLGIKDIYEKISHSSDNSSEKEELIKSWFDTVRKINTDIQNKELDRKARTMTKNDIYFDADEYGDLDL